MITLETFEDRLDRWGGALERWPADARREAEALVATSEPARRLLAVMGEVEAALALPGFGAPDLDLSAASRFAAVATRHAQDRRRSPMVRRAGWGAAAAAALVLGILAGHADVGRTHEDNPDRLLASALNLGTGNVDVE